MKKCDGMPLAIETLAGALHNKRGIEAWRAIRDSKFVNVQDLQESMCNLDAELFSSPRSSEAVFHILCYISKRLHNKTHRLQAATRTECGPPLDRPRRLLGPRGRPTIGLERLGQLRVVVLRTGPAVVVGPR